MTSLNFSHVAAEITFNHTKNDKVKKIYCSNDQKTKEITLRQHTLTTNLEDCILMKHCKKKIKEKALNNHKQQRNWSKSPHLMKLKSFLMLRTYSDETQISRVKYSRVCDRSSWMELKKSPDQNTKQEWW